MSMAGSIDVISKDIGSVHPEKQSTFLSAGTGDAVIEIPDSRATTVVDKSPTVHAPSATERAQAQREIKQTITKSLQEYPKGYPLLAAFQSSESSWSIYRAFNYLHSRVILELQDELRVLEEQLSDLDEIDHLCGNTDRLQSRSVELEEAKKEQTDSERLGLIAKIREKLVNYDEILVKARDLNAFQRPSHRDYGSFRTWFWNKKPISYESEEEYIKRKEDLVTLRHGREWAGFDGVIENCIRKLDCKWIQKLFTTPELRAKTNDQCIFYYSAERIAKLVGVIITSIIFILLVLPVVAMYKLTYIDNRNSTFDAVGILVVFTLLFSAAMSLLTKAKRHELFAASAAYCAVLVVFISNFNNANDKVSHVVAT